MIDSEQIKLRYKQVEKEVDERGRLITVGRLKLSQMLKINELSDSEENRTMLLLVASIRSIDDDHLSFPRNRGEVDSVLDRLDREGFAAAAKAFKRLEPDDASAGGPDAGDA